MQKSKKERTHFICQNCGAESPRWQGRCPSCDSWNTFVEEKVLPVVAKPGAVMPGSYSSPVALNKVETDHSARIQLVSAELNRVLGGGIVQGSIVLVGGDPGIGKSTLLLQEAARLCSEKFPVLYVAGEESSHQIKLRANRLHLASDDLYILPETDLEAALYAIDSIQPKMVIVDSIQTVFSGKLESAPGSISQVRECALQLIRVAKTRFIPIFLVGHVTKEGYLAGPKVLEHMVDALLLFEGDRDHFYRIIRAVKNRFGSTREIGVFEMTERGLQDVPNPSAIFLSERRTEASGSTVICCLEGTRPILVELQALVAPTNYGMPQRTMTGLDHKRVYMLLAVLEKRLSYRLGTMDVFVNAAGGFRVDETVADLGVVACVTSSLLNRVIDPHAMIMGEVGLGGEIRSISHIAARLSEGEKMGFQRAVVPKGNLKNLVWNGKLQLLPVRTAHEALEAVLQ